MCQALCQAVPKASPKSVSSTVTLRSNLADGGCCIELGNPKFRSRSAKPSGLDRPGSAREFFNLQMYRPIGVAPSSAPGSFVLRTRSDPAVLRPLLSRAVEGAGVGVTLRDVVAAKATLEYAFARPRFAVVLFGAFALLAVALAAVGLFGIVAFAVARRRREIGIRVAVGAAPAVVSRLILGEGLRLAVVGCGLGLLGVYATTRTLTASFYGLTPPDSTLLISAMLLLIAVAVLATLVPMRRALRIEPTKALRAE
jgi:putative ABC transport system permease protein